MREYKVENGEVDIEKLTAEFIDTEIYRGAHKGLIIPCHDIFLEYEKGILLVKRLNFPAKDFLWPLGGRINRGESIEDSLREKVLAEAMLEIDSLTELGRARTYFKTDPFGHGHGTDTINFVYFGVGRGSLKLDNLHEKPTIITRKNYKADKQNLHPYVKDFMDIAISLVS